MTRSAPGLTAEVGIAAPAFRLPAATRPGPVRLQVAELDRSLAFYRDVLGFGVLDRADGSATLGADRPLVVLEEKPGARPVPRRGRLGLFHVAFLLPSRADLGRFVRHLADLGVPAGASDHLVSEALYLSDPDGLGIEVYADRPREAWRRDGRQIAMATEPLDLQDVVRDAGNTPWDGAPDGTTVGHVHLHVGALDRAAAFYHEALGLDKIVWGYPGALFLSVGGYHHHLGLNTWAAGAPPAGEDDARLLEWSLVLPSESDIEAVVESLSAAGHPVGPDRRVADPWGTTLRLTTTD